MAPVNRYRQKWPDALLIAKDSGHPDVNGLSPATNLVMDLDKQPFSDGH